MTDEAKRSQRGAGISWEDRRSKSKDAEISDSGGEQFGGEEGASQVAQR